MQSVTQVQFLGEACFISLCINDLRKGINLSLLSQAMGK